MAPSCPACHRLNPDAARYCHYDGVALPGSQLEAPIAVGARPFLAPFVFPSGRACRNFDELVRGCDAEWEEARDLLESGVFEGFLGSLGRADLSLAARQASREADADHALDVFLARLPGERTAPKLHAAPREINLGQLTDTSPRSFSLQISNRGGGLLSGAARSEVAWLALGDPPGAPDKLFHCRGELNLPVQVHPSALRAGNKPQEGRIVIESGNASIVVLVRAGRPVLPFSEGKLAGATTPRELASLARDHPRDAGPLFESGAVARWYRGNGWVYPVQGPAASGTAAVQQFFEALGLTRPPKVQISQTHVELTASPGGSVEHHLFVETPENRPVYARASSETDWLEFGKTQHKGASARVHLRVPRVPVRPGQTLTGRAVVTANGNQRFDVVVLLHVQGTTVGGQVAPPIRRGAIEVVSAPVASVREIPMGVPPAAETLVRPPGVAMTEVTAPMVFRDEPPSQAPPPPPPLPPRPAPRRMPVVPPPVDEEIPTRQSGFLLHCVAPTLILLVLFGTVVHDLLLPAGANSGDGPVLLDPRPVVELRFDDAPNPDKFGPPDRSMTFGLAVRDPATGQQVKRLMFDEWGRTNNICVRIDGKDYLVGHPDVLGVPGSPPRREVGIGGWLELKRPLGKDRGRVRDGAKSVWRIEGPPGLRLGIVITQTVEIVPGEQSGRLDTALIRYTLDNHGDRPHDVGLRFLLDTYIGKNDGVPFTIPGQAGLCSTLRSFDKPTDVPDYIQALENDNLLSPGTVAHVQFRVPGPLEPPSRVLLGAYPDKPLQDLGHHQAFGWLTVWDVPVVPIHEMANRRRELENLKREAVPDSAVTLYWDVATLQPRKKREVGFSYGLGEVASSEGQGKLLLTVGGRTVRDGEFSLTALRADPVPGEKLTLRLPDGEAFQLRSQAEQPVPPVDAGAARPISTVTWRLLGRQTGRFTLTVESSAGVRQKQAIRIHPPRTGILD